MEEVRPGLHRWTARHPDWDGSEGGENGWEPDVTCLAWEGEGALVLIDPLVQDGDWSALDALVAGRDVPVAVVTTCHWHGRSAGEARKRYVNPAAITWAPGAMQERLEFKVDEPFEAPASIPGGVEALDAARGNGEVVLWIEAVRTLVAADVLLGAEGERTTPLRLCPEDWLDDATLADVRQALNPLLELEIEAIVPLHGAPVTSGAKELLQGLLAEPEPRYT